ncbi:hypothetical protein [Ruminococcus sp.]|uniref:hypothetical protein n=1 Tax=Ruminococcus sp. TaxID=41978 RepID=UPI0038689E87
MNKIIWIVGLVTLCLYFSGCFPNLEDIARTEAEAEAHFNEYCPPSYIDKECDWVGIRDITECDRYYYDSDIADQLLDAGYKKVASDEDRQNVIAYFEEVEADLNDHSQFDFDHHMITSDDLYSYFKRTEDSYDTEMFFYDRESYTLYYLVHMT